MAGLGKHLGKVGLGRGIGWNKTQTPGGITEPRHPIKRFIGEKLHLGEGNLEEF